MTEFTFSKYRAVVFDLDSTLTDPHNYPLRASMWLLEQCTDDVESVADEYLKHLVVNYRRGIREIVEGAPYRTPLEIVKRAMMESLEAVGLNVDDSVIEEGTRLFKWLHVETSTVSSNVERFLQKLQDTGLKLGVITNSFEKHLQVILTKLDLLKYFSCFVDSGDVEAFKPMSAPFNLIVDCLGTKAVETLFIGDEYYADIVGATSFGMDAIWVNNRGGDLDEMISRYGEDTRPILVVNAVAELEDYL